MRRSAITSMVASTRSAAGRTRRSASSVRRRRGRRSRGAGESARPFSLRPCSSAPAWMPSSRSTPSPPASSARGSRAARYGAVQRHPAHDLRVHEVCSAPQICRCPRPCRYRRARRYQRRRPGGPGGRIRAPISSRGEPTAEQLAVDIDLTLSSGPVADPARGCPASRKVAQHPLGQVPLTAHAEHDLPGRRRRAGGPPRCAQKAKNFADLQGSPISGPRHAAGKANRRRSAAPDIPRGNQPPEPS